MCCFLLFGGAFWWCFLVLQPLAGNSGRLTRVRHSSRKSSATHSNRCVQYLRVSKQWYGCQCHFWIFNVNTDVDSARDCTRWLYGHSKTENTLKMDSGRNIPCRTWTRTRVSIAPGFSVGCSTNCVIPCLWRWNHQWFFNLIYIYSPDNIIPDNTLLAQTTHCSGQLA